MTTARNITPRFIRLRDAAIFFGMDRNRFNAEVRPRLTEIRIGRQGIAFDILEMNAIADALKAEQGKPPQAKGGHRCLTRNHQGSYYAGTSGTSTRGSAGADFAKVVKRLRLG